jgi:hypothetical protein
VKVLLTQFMRPSGREVPVSAEIDDTLADKVSIIRSYKCRFTCEVLTTNQVSIAIEHEEGDFTIELASNAPNAPTQALEKLIREFKPDEFAEWLNLVRGVVE